MVNKTKSRKIKELNPKVIRTLSLHLVILAEPIFEKMIYDG